MKAPEKTSDQPRPVPARGPIFVDASGRRFRRVRLMGLAVLGLVGGYVVLLMAAFIGGSGVSAPFLPLPAAAGPPPEPSRTAAPVPGAVSSQSAAPPSAAAVPVVAQSPASVPQLAPAVPPAPEAAPAPAAPPVPAAVPAPVPVPSGPGMGGTAPGSSGTAPGSSATAPGVNGAAPGQATKPTAPAHP
jgi:hypothetical protein